jgi:hypothetical protein
MKASTRTIPVIILGALTVIGLVLLCVFSASNFAEANRLQKVFDSIGETAILDAAYNIRYVALLHFLWFCLGVVVAWWGDMLFIHPAKRTITNIIMYGVLTLFAVAVAITFALLQGKTAVMKYAYVYMIISIAGLLILAYIAPIVIEKLHIGVAKVGSD